MARSKFFRTVSALLMLVAMVLPATPSTLASDVEVRAAHMSGGVTPAGTPSAPILDAADCTPSNAGTARYFASARSTTGVDINNAQGRLVFDPTSPVGLPGGTAPTQNLSNGDFESQANDGQFGSGCTPGVNDGHLNDLASTFVPSFPGINWLLVVTAPGFIPRTVSLAGLTDGTGGCPLVDADLTRAGCLISVATVDLNPLAAPAGRGTVAGSVFQTNGTPLDGATVVLTDTSGLVHTRVSGSDCDGRAVAGTGFYCFASSVGSGTPPIPTGLAVAGLNDGLGLPVGPATITIVNNTAANCITGTPGTACGFLPSTVTVQVTAGAVSGQDVTLQNKFAPASAPAAPAGANGYVVNGQGQGVGGITITATTAAGFLATATCPTNPASLGTCTQTGLWVIGGLPALTAVTFTISGPGLTAANVRPALAITRTTTVAGTWIDPNWIIVQAGPATGTIPLPITGSGIIRGTVTDSQGAPFTGPGALALLYRDSSRDIAAATQFSAGVPSVNAPAQGARPPVGFFPAGNNVIPLIQAAPLDAGGNYCFGAGCPGIAQPPLLPDTYLVTILDDRWISPAASVACVPGFQPPTGGIGPAPCGHLPQTSQPIIAPSDQVTTVNFAMRAKFSPGALPGAPVGAPTGVTGLFGFIWDMGVPGGRPIQGQTVYAVPITGPLASPAAVGQAATILAGGVAGAAALYNLVATVPLTGAGILTGTVTTNQPAPIINGIFNPTFPGSDPFGMYRILGLTAATSYAIIVEIPQGYNNCGPNNVQVGIPAQGYPFPLTGFLQPSSIIRCAMQVTTPAAAAVAVTPWISGADFAFAPQQLRPLEPGEVDRRLEAVVPFVSNGGPTAATGGWELQTTEIHVLNAGAQRTIAEVRFYASDGLGGAAVLAGTQTADLVPGGQRVFRAPEMPGGFLGWAGVWAFDADGPGGVYGQSSLAIESSVAVRSAGNAITSVSGIPREQILSPSSTSLLPLAFRKYGGGVDKWSTLIVATNMGDSAPVVFTFRSADTLRTDARRCAVACTITRYANRGGMITLNLGDDTDPDIMFLAEGTYAVDVSAGGPQDLSAWSGVLPGVVNAPVPGGYVVYGIHVTATGKMATAGQAQVRVGQSGPWGQSVNENTGALYAPMLFNNYNGWDSAIAVTTGQTSGGVSAAITVSFYDEGGGFIGDISNRVSSSSQWYVYLPAVGFIPEKFRGTAVIRTMSASGGQLSALAGTNVGGMVQHVNYGRNAATSYDLIGSSAVVYRTDAQGELPCIALGFANCAWAADVQRTGGSVVADRQQLGVQTGIRLFNPDPLQTGLPALVTVVYIDASGAAPGEASQQFQIPPFGVHTLFPTYDGRLPEVFRGAARIMSSGNVVVGVANTVDYTVSDHDASGAYNLQYNTGRTN